MIRKAKIRVLIVDDSAVARRLLRQALEADPEIEVVGTAEDPIEAGDRIVRLRPDVLTLDLEMPRMDGLTFLRLLMERRPLPVLVLSSMTQHGSEFVFEALRLGAVDVVGKPDGRSNLSGFAADLAAKVKAAARANLASVGADAAGAPIFSGLRQPERGADVRALILLGASTGGIEALRTILTSLPASIPPVAIVQHIPAAFSGAFARRLGELGELRVKEAEEGDRLVPGRALIAPGGRHLLLRWTGKGYIARLSDGPALWHQRPAIDVLFRSAAAAGAGAGCVAGVLTGMGSDGADGLLRLRQRGAVTFAQDESTSVVYGMPRAAVENGAAQSSLPLSGIAPFLQRAFPDPVLPSAT